MLNGLKIGYKINSNQQISHVIYLDDFIIITRTEAHSQIRIEFHKQIIDDKCFGSSSAFVKLWHTWVE